MNSMGEATIKLLLPGIRRRVPVILQTETAECGNTCLAMIGHYYGLDIDMNRLREQVFSSSRGDTLKKIIASAEMLNLAARAVSLDISEIADLKLPCILHWNMNHYVVLTAIKGNRVIIHDPASGRRILSRQSLSQHFTGIALELWPTAEFQPQRVRSGFQLRKIISGMRGLKAVLTKIFFLSLIIEVINLLLPMGTQLVTDYVIESGDYSLLTLICLGLFLFVFFRTFIAMIRTWISVRLGATIDIQWKSSLFSHLINLPLTFFEKRKLGDIQSRFSSLDTLRATLTGSIVSGIIDALMSVLVAVMLFLYGGYLGGVVLLFTAIYITVRLIAWPYYRQANEEYLVKNARSGSHFMESLYGMGTIKSSGLSRMRTAQWSNLAVDAINASIKTTQLDALFTGINQFISILSQVCMLWLGASAVMENQMTLGMFIAFNAYRGQFADRSASLVDALLKLRLLSLHSERIADIALAEPEVIATERCIFPAGQPVTLRAENLAFQFDNFSKPLFKGLSLQVTAGESVAITGPSGSGKTTLMKVLCGLLEPTSGKIIIGDLDIHQIGLSNYRSAIACVLQDDKLFSGSVAENITSFDSEPDYEFMMVCTRQCNIHQEIMAMPMGYDTLIGELGSTLSGGQKQRIMIARALYRRPGILFMDEATSHLDLENEALINQAIAKLQITRIFIAHRPSTIASAQRVIEFGTSSD